MSRLCEVTGKTYAQMNMLGGGIKDTLLCRMSANAMNLKVVAGPSEATVIGNISCQLLALGEMKDVREVREVVKNSTPLAIYEPTEAALWDAHFEEYCKYLGKSGK
jgi:rhamnulokinase/L-fuculokinase